MIGSASRPLHLFTVGRIPVYADAWYFLIVLYAGYTLGDPMAAILWVLAVTLSILVHEFGHALVARSYKLLPRILLHGWGGLCAHERALRDRHDVLILLAGPAAGLALGGVVFSAGWLIDAQAPYFFYEHQGAYLLRRFLLWINLVWSLANLAPIWPLDGGQLFRLLMLNLAKPARAERIAHAVGLSLAAAAGIWAMQTGWLWVAFLSAFLAFENFRRMHTAGTGQSGVVRRKNRFAKGLTGDAQRALCAGDWREAARLAHVARSETNLLPETVRQLWAILTVASCELGEHEEALRYARRAPDVPAVAEAKLRSFFALGRVDEARALTATRAFKKLPEEQRRELERLVA